MLTRCYARCFFDWLKSNTIQYISKLRVLLVDWIGADDGTKDLNFGNFTVVIQGMAETFGLETKKNMQTFVNREPFEIPWTKKI